MILEPNQEILDDLANALDVGLPFYMAYAHKFGDCADTLAKILEKYSRVIKWEVCPWISSNAVFPYIHSANISKSGTVRILLDPETIESGDILDIDEFKKYATHCIEHEAVHMSQRDRMGHEFYAGNRNTGYRKMQDYYLTCDDPFNLTTEEEYAGMQLYLADHLELMAHAKDLSGEILYADEPLVALCDPEGYIDFLPTWYKYRQVGFLRSDPVIKQLLKYTYNYVILTNLKKEEHKKKIWNDRKLR